MGKRRPTLDLLIPLARVHRVSLDQPGRSTRHWRSSGTPEALPARQRQHRHPTDGLPRAHPSLQAGVGAAPAQACRPSGIRMALRAGWDASRPRW
ncbi:hypothetical protein [Nocardioides convexus]|uniref:hypothetical protein n=1 Tax=Nocardioides convexus TaxID=2712224 RepID=UPI0024187BC8|nr:hypothetical protein [Nocardioides convexus]